MLFQGILLTECNYHVQTSNQIPYGHLLISRFHRTCNNVIGLELLMQQKKSIAFVFMIAFDRAKQERYIE